MKKHSKKQIILLIMSILLILASMLFFTYPYILKFYQEQKFIFYWTSFSTLLFLIRFYEIPKNLKKIDSIFNQQKYILENITPQKGIVEDFLVYQEVCYHNSNDPFIKMKFIPVVKNLQNEKRYATYGDYSFSSCKYHWKQLFTGLLQFSYTDINDLEIQIGSSAYLYILEELSLPILKENNLITIYNRNLPYVGSLERIPQNENYKWKANYSQSGVFNINNEIPLFEQPIICFKGMTDFEEIPSVEIYKTFNQKWRKEKLFNMILSTLLIPITGLIITILLFCSNILA